MKKIIVLIVVLLIFILSGCSGSSKYLHFDTYAGNLYEVEENDD